MGVRIDVDMAKCTGEGTCVEVCPVKVFELREIPEYKNQMKSVVIDKDACLACRACESQCPTLAITITEEE